MYHNSNEIYQFDKDRRKYCRYDEETEKSIKNKNGRTGRQPNACLFFRYQMVRKWKPISYFTLTFTITFFSSTSVTPGA
ncbi:Uncharacterised protein [uncultured Bacteroides sp.]|nr:Uncharacterised protein [uncultured Bacteroides sp.]